MSTKEIQTNHRTVTDHKIGGIDNSLDVTVLDEPGAGGACHEYVISYLSDPDEHGNCFGMQLCKISFQNGPVKEHGVNGITQESLIAICIDRLRCFQAGEYACEDNQAALMNLELALELLQKRTRDRLSRGVEGTSAH
ncbi:MAG: hypothetical protein ACRCYP_03790 [Alphaproteobacteria bacterium]